MGMAQPTRAQLWNGTVVCGGSSFSVCASVSVTVTGNVVTMDVWNLSGLYGSDPNTLFTRIGFYGSGTAGAAAVQGSLTMTGATTGPRRPGVWTLRPPDTIGGIEMDMTTAATAGSTVANGIASGCATALPSTMAFWQSYGCNAALPAEEGGFTPVGAVRISFQITGTMDLAHTQVLIKGQNGTTNVTTLCVTGHNCSLVTPEPVTIALLGSGLAGMGGFGLLRRRRRKS